MWDTLWQDLTYAIRTFARSPGFTAVAVITLALGIGANTAIFSVINGVLFQPLRFGQPNDLTVVWETSAAENVEKSETAAGTFLDWRERNQTMDDLTAWTWETFVLQSDDESVSLTGVLVYPNFLSVLRTDPLFGRAFTMDDAMPGRRGDVLLISHALWTDRWGGDPGVVGRTVRLDGRPLTIVGVMPPDVAAPDTEAQLWQPVGFYSPMRWERHNRRLTVYGRLKPGVTLAQAQGDLSRVAAQLREGQYADIYRGWDARVVPLRDEIVGDSRATLVVAFAAVGLVLLIACVNIANMLLARAAARQREIAVRSALGAGQGRITRQVLTESVILGLGGGLLGVGFAAFTHRLLLSFQPGIIPRAEELALDSAALGFAVGVSVLTGLLFGLAPVLQSTRVDLQEALKEGGSRSATAGRRQNRLRALLVTAQLALATVLLCGAGLLIRTMLELQGVDPGFKPQGAVAARMFLDGSRYDSTALVRHYFQEALQRLRALPGVEFVGASSALPTDPMGDNYDLPYRLEGQRELPSNELPQADFRVVTPGYFESLQVPLLSGRLMSDADRSDTPFVALVNQSMARQTWPGQSPLGKRFETPSTDWHWFEVVGVVGDTRYYGLDSEPRPEIYVAHAQVPRTIMTFVVRTDGPPAASADAVRGALLELDPDQPSHSIVTLETLVSDTIATERFYTLVLGILAAVALVLASAGIYGVLSYWVNQRTQEIGVRLALGATRGTVLRHVVGHGMSLAATGIVIGLAGALASTRVLSNTLYGVGSGDPITFTAVALTLGGIAALACCVPALRASRLDPVAALRQE